MIRFLTNLKLRRKLMIAMVPLALMVALAGLYATFQIKSIDSKYGELLDNDVKSLQSVTTQRSHSMRFGMVLYNLIAEKDRERVRALDEELDSCTSGSTGYFGRIPSAKPQSRWRNKSSSGFV